MAKLGDPTDTEKAGSNARLFSAIFLSLIVMFLLCLGTCSITEYNQGHLDGYCRAMSEQEHSELPKMYVKKLNLNSNTTYWQKIITGD